MKENLSSKMKTAGITLKRYASKECEGWLSDNYYILIQATKEAEKGCRAAQKRINGSDMLPGLFDSCIRICKNGVLPDEEAIVKALDGKVNGLVAEFLPLCFTCALIDYAAKNSKKENGTKILANAVKSLRRMAETDFEFIIESISDVEKILSNDPSGIYQIMDEKSKSVYRKSIAHAAVKADIKETKLAERILQKAQMKNLHVGKFITEKKKHTRGWLMILMQNIMPLAVCIASGILLKSFTAAILLFYPLRELFLRPVEAAFLAGIQPNRMLRLKSDDASVSEQKVLITVSTIMPEPEKALPLAAHLEKLYLSNRTKGVKVCCLADFKSAYSPIMPEDELAVKAMNEALERLNKKYGGGFLLAVRPRTYSRTQDEFTGRERKRGAITDLIKAIKGEEKGFYGIYGDKSELDKTKYLFALDADTVPEFDAVKELVAIAEHPLNRPVIDKNAGRVTDGYGIIVPSAVSKLECEDSTLFSRLTSDMSAGSFYGKLFCEKYHDLFGEGVFCGKGLIDVEAYNELMTVNLPKEIILSHDIIESGFLRAGFACDVSVSESVPKSAQSHFARLHRWIRGDWQNIGFIFGKNPLNSVSRYKLFDNLLRSITKPLLICLLITSMFLKGYAGLILAAASVAAIVSPELKTAFGYLRKNGFSAITRIYYSQTMPETLSGMVRAFASLALAVHESFISLDAICKALWRMLVSKKNLLEWVPAASAEKKRSKISAIAGCIPSVVVGAVLFVLGTPFHRLIAIVFLFDIPLSVFASKKPEKENKKLTAENREKLLSYASAMWGYFDELCNKENNFLPPDNIQLAPVRAHAHRTSPTDIGMMLVSFLAARDLGFITSQELYIRLSMSMKSIDKLEKYKGNLLNWYNTKDLTPLNPVFVSTVDSGNFLCCLTVLKEGLKEYVSECPSLAEIIAWSLKIVRETDLNALYNKKRGLFYTGISPENEEKSTSYYDLYISEARLTSYFAVAHRIVPKNHWGNLGRIVVSQDRRCGLASWTGTMFEYYMPSLFIPSPKGSVAYESINFCLFSQRKRVGKLPFGISESGFYAFDGNLNYQYKAHGVQKLGLSRGLDKELVISPYSSFLTLATAPNLSVSNLIRLEKMGMCGKYGFFEAADFTENRVKEKFASVKSFMVHHLGMSMTAAVNALKNDCMQKRFMRDSHMKGAETLLYEKLSEDSPVFKDVYKREAPKVAEKGKGQGQVYRNPSPVNPKAAIYSNGRLTLCVTDSSTGHVIFDGMDLTVKSEDILSRPQGIFALFKTEDINLSNAPFLADETAENRTEFSKQRVESVCKSKNLSLKVSTAVLKNENCLTQRIKITNTDSKKPVKGKLFIYFEPCLSKTADFASHPAYSRLFLRNRWDSENNCCVFTRNVKNKDEAISIAAGLKEKTNQRHETSRERVLSRPNGIFSLGEKEDFTGETNNVDCCCAFVAEIEVPEKESISLELIVAAGDSEKEALNSFAKVKSYKSANELANNIFSEDNFERATADRILPSLFYPKSLTQGIKAGNNTNTKIEDLWSFGISGDLPIVLINIKDAHEIANSAEYVRVNKKLRMCGISSDLVFVHSIKDGYNSEITAEVRRLILNEKCELMFGVKGGIHLINLSNFSPEKAKILEISASVCIDNEKTEKIEEKVIFKPLKTVNTLNRENTSKEVNNVKEHSFTSGEISIKNALKTVDIPWCSVYANQSFGTLVSDKSLGFTWALNSRQNKLTPWYNDTVSDNRGEILYLKNNGVFYDLIALSDAVFTPDKATWKVACCGLDFRVTTQVPKRGMVKKITVEIRNNSDAVKNIDLMYFTLPVLGVNREERSFFSGKRTDKGACISNSNGDFSGTLFLQCNTKADYVCFSRKDFKEGKLNSDDYVPNDCCLAVGRKLSVAAGGKINLNFYLSWAVNEKAAEKLPFCSDFSPKNLNPYILQSKNEDLNLFFNSFLYSQILQTRFYARTGFYQCSGAYGFRDQLQDSLAFLDSEPEITKTHILRCAAVQFEQGDVLHWWHIGLKKSQIIKGVRTKCSDDMLWLPFVCCEYIRKTGDYDILKIKVPYLVGEELKKDEKERFITPKRTEYKETLFEHCIKAAERAAVFGKNGLPLIGSCDWNDAFNNIGSDSEGESVWLGMFMIVVYRKMAELCGKTGAEAEKKQFEESADRLKTAIENNFWYNDHYSRAVLKDGAVLGKDNGFLDILPQAFSVFAGLKNCDIAVETAVRELSDEKNRVIKLLKPPFFTDDYEKIGYIALYPRGVRENGGQYTHAAVWLAMSLFALGKTEVGEKILDLINPVGYYKNEKTAKAYLAEPYVLAGDVYFGKNLTSRAGWTHFTGSAGWFYQCVTENYSDCLIPNFKTDKKLKSKPCKVFEVDKTK